VLPANQKQCLWGARRMAAVLCEASAVLARGRTDCGRLRSGSFQIKEVLIEPGIIFYSESHRWLVHCLYVGRHRQRRRHGQEKQESRLGGPVCLALFPPLVLCCSRLYFSWCPIPPNGAAARRQAESGVTQ